MKWRSVELEPELILSRAKRVVVERLRHFPVLIGRHVRAAEVIELKGLFCRRCIDAAPPHRRESVPSGAKTCFVVVAVSELEATLWYGVAGYEVVALPVALNMRWPVWS